MRSHSFFKNLPSSQQGKISLWISIPLAALAIILALYFLFANTLLKSVAQNAFGDTSGAEVNIDNVEHSFFPFGITLTRLQATDNANPMRNKLEIASVKADVDLMPLFNRKLIIEELLIQDLEFDTQRITEGAIYMAPKEQVSRFTFPTLEDLPSVDEILEKSPLKTTAAVAEAQKVLKQYQPVLEEKYASLPNKNKLKVYKERLQVLKETDYKNLIELAAAKKEFNDIKNAIGQDKAKATEFIDLAKEAKEASSSSLAALKSAPQEDYDLLKGLLAGNREAIGQVTQHMFGDKAEMYTHSLFAAMDILAGGADENAEEKVAVDDGLPNLWIKKAAVNIKWQDEQIETAWQNITDQHALVGSPTTFLVNSSKAKNWKKIDLNGNFEIVKGKVNSVQNWDIHGLVLDTVELLPKESKQKLNALLESGLLASKGGIQIINGQVSGSSIFDLSDLKLQAIGKNHLSSAMAEVISDLSDLKFTTDFSGNIASPSIKVKSDLDKKMLQALTSGLTGDSSGKLGELKSKLNAKVAKQLGTSGDQFKSVDALLAAVQGDANSLNELLKSQMTNAIDSKKDKLLNKLGDKLFRDE
jgi:uncharacterized protein (TIGR03545 family)